jgi:hypothetical protein
VDGVVLADAITHPAATETAAQQAVKSARLADVKALAQHSASQS